jgi:Zn-dependent peptidase ImmA (M78 family)
VEPQFNPKNLRYDESGIPRLGPTEIEAIATELLSLYCPDVLQRPSITPVLVIIDKLKARTKLTFEMGDLGLFKGEKVLGCVNLNTRTLSLDNILIGARRMSLLFTAAHEIGHWVIHRHNFRNWKLNETEEAGTLIDDEKTLHRLSQRTPREWLEYQANVFASCLVMPRSTFMQAVSDQQAEMGISRNLGEVFLTSANYSRKDYHDLRTRLSKVFDVSVTSVGVRIATLKLLREEPVRRPSAPDEGPPTQNIRDLIGRVLPRKTN